MKTLKYLLPVFIFCVLGNSELQAQEFITTWKTDNPGTSNDDQITIPTTGISYNYTVDWGDGNTDIGQTGNTTHTYAMAGTYTVTITGDFPQIYFNDTGDAQKLLTVQQWGTISWTSMAGAFYGCSNLTIPATDAPDLTGVTDISLMFASATSFNGDISSWNVSNVTTMEGMFESASSFNGDISSWNVSNVTTMQSMFYEASSFNQDISAWNVSNVTDMSEMFASATSFNQDISSWNVSNVTDMQYMFFEASSFNQNLGIWNVSNVTTMEGMFSAADSFNQDISSWNVSNVTTMEGMFSAADSFNQDISAWNVSNVTTMEGMLENSGLSITNYDNLLTGWAALPSLQRNVTLGATGINFCNGTAGRNTLVNTHGWNITDDNSDCLPLFFITTWKTDNPGTSNDNQITIPTTGSGYTYTVDWGDSNTNTNQTGNATHTYAAPGEYEVRISGDFPQIYFNDAGDKDKLLTVQQWGEISWTSMASAFYGCSNLTIPATDAPDLTGVTDMSNMFRSASAFNQDLSTWNVSNVTDMERMFAGASSFNQDISIWNVSNVTTMQSMFDNSGLSSTNYDNLLTGWAALPSLQRNVTLGATGINYCNGTAGRNTLVNTHGWNITDDNSDCLPLFFTTTWKTDNPGTSNDNQITIPTTGSGYNYTVDWGDRTATTTHTGNATHTYAMAGTYTVTITGDFPRIYFNNTGDKDKLLTVQQWGEISWARMVSAFYGCSNLTIPATDAPDLTGVTDMSFMFAGASSFNQDISTWDVSNVTNMRVMFNGASSFNQDLSSWDVSNVTNMRFMFALARSFNGDISSWNVSNVTDMSFMFGGTSFNQDISAWDVSSVTTMRDMFRSATSFNQNLGNWNVSNVTNMEGMFFGATSFNQNLGNWNVSSVTADMAFIFFNVTLSTVNYNALLRGWSALDDLQPNVTFSAGNSTYCAAIAKDILTGAPNNWTIMDGGVADGCDSHFVTTWRVAAGDRDITIPTFSEETYDYTVDWGDGDVSTSQTGDTTHTYAMAGTYTVTITGDFPQIYFNDAGDKDKLLTVQQWGTISWTSMAGAFHGCSNLAIPADDAPDLTGVTDMTFMFASATSFNGDISSWNVSNVTDMSNMLDNSGLSSTNYDNLLTGWAALPSLQRNVTLGATGINFCNGIAGREILANTNGWNITDAGSNCLPFFITTWKTDNPGTSNDDQITIPTTGIDYNYTVDWGDRTATTTHTGNATHTYAMAGTYTVTITGDFPRIYFNHTGDREKLLTVQQWGTISWTSMAGAFFGCSNLTIPATDAPDLTRVTDMSSMFNSAGSLNQDISSWNVSNVTAMANMFNSASSFNQDINIWNVSNVTNMFAMFTGSTGFNGDISSWNVSNVTDMTFMFNAASAFNQDLSTWNVSNVTDMGFMFFEASSFNQDIGTWDVSSVTTMANMLDNSGLTSTNYDNLLNGWAALPSPRSGVVLGATGINFCNGIAGREILANTNGWNITDAGSNCLPFFITTWKTDNPGTSNDDQITIPTTGIDYNYTVDWGDRTATTTHTGNATHTYAMAGTYTVTITGDFPRIYFNHTGDREKLLTVQQWGTISWTSMAGAFFGCSNLTIPATDAPDLTRVTDMSSMFNSAGSLNQDISSWNVSNVTAMANMFNSASSFNQDINIWNVSNVTNMFAMFTGSTGFNGDISSWNVSNVTDMTFMFNAASAFNQDLSTWNVSKVTDMSFMFQSATSFNGDISSWNVSNVTDMDFMFFEASSFNQDIGIWDVSSVTTMANMLDNSGLTSTNYDNLLNGWAALPSPRSGVVLGAAGINFCTGTADRDILTGTHGWTITDAGSNCLPFFITTWKTDNPGTSNDNQIRIPTTETGYDYSVNWGDDTSDTNVTGNITHTYATAGTYTVAITGDFPRIYFNNAGDREKIININQWGDQVWTSMANAFDGCSNLTIPATDAPDLTGVTDMSVMFAGASVFNGDISSWDVSGVTNMRFMFALARSFNGDISSWNVSNVTDMITMFTEATSFNQDISSWNVSNVTNMRFMFSEASAFNANLGSWNVSNVTDMENMLDNSGLSSTNYDNLLTGWAALPSLQSNVPLGATGINYCNGTAGRNTLVNTHGWNITDAGSNCFITTWKTDNPGTSNDNQIRIPTTETGYDYSVNWGDDTSDTNVTGNITHTYATAGTYTVAITGDFPRIYFNNVGDREKIIAINQWGDQVWTSMANAFNGCSNLTIPATDAPDLTGVTDMSVIFRDAGSFNGDISSWDVSNVTDMSLMFFRASSFNEDISNWNVGNVTDMSEMFASATSFNEDISNWNVGNVTTMAGMFNTASSFNGDISNWNVSKVTTMSFMFSEATSFNQDLSRWNVGNVENMSLMFSEATSFNQNPGTWNVSNVTTMSFMFSEATSFNQDLSRWNVGNVENMSFMFASATSFNGDISRWNVSNVVDMSFMFESATSFNQDISTWNVGNVTTMVGMFNTSGLSSTNYDNLLTGWAALPSLQSNVPLGATGINYCNGTAGRNTLVNTHGWNITGDQQSCNVETDITAFSFPAQTGVAVIDGTAHTVAVGVSPGTTLTSLVPTIAVSSGATINPASGMAQDFSNDVVYTVTVQDGSTTQAWTVTVTVNLVPSDIALANSTIAENNAVNDVIGVLSTTDGNTSDTHTYSLVAGTGGTDNASFSISGSNLVAAVVFDHEMKSAYSVRIAADDGNGGTFAKAFALTINNVPDLTQTITFGTLAAVTFGGSSFGLAATASSTLNVSYSSSDFSVVSVAGNMVTIVGAGTTTITASQAGNADYIAAPDATQNLVVNQADQTITLTPVTDKGDIDPPFDVIVSSTSRLAVTLRVSGPATISGTTLTLDGTSGTVTITASQAGNDNYHAATSVEESFKVVTKQAQTITFGALAAVTSGGASFNLAATASSTLNVSYTSSEPLVASIAGSTVTIEGVGTTIITASQAGDADYIAATDVAQDLVVNREDQTITLTPVADKVTTDAPFDVVASSTSRLPITLTVNGPATISATTLTLVGTSGTVTVTADQAGNDNYNVAPSVVQSFDVVDMKTVTGLEEEAPANKIILHPIPANNTIYIDMGDQKLLEMILTDLNGKQLTVHAQDSQLDISSLKEGYYILRITTDQGVFSQKIIKQ